VNDFSSPFSHCMQNLFTFLSHFFLLFLKNGNLFVVILLNTKIFFSIPWFFFNLNYVHSNKHVTLECFLKYSTLLYILDTWAWGCMSMYNLVQYQPTSHALIFHWFLHIIIVFSSSQIQILFCSRYLSSIFFCCSVNWYWKFCTLSIMLMYYRHMFIKFSQVYISLSLFHTLILEQASSVWIMIFSVNCVKTHGKFLAFWKSIYGYCVELI